MSRLTAKQCFASESVFKKLAGTSILQHGSTSAGKSDHIQALRYNFLGPQPTGQESQRSWMKKKKWHKGDSDWRANWSERTQRANGHARKRRVWREEEETGKWVIVRDADERLEETSWRMESVLVAQPRWGSPPRQRGDGNTMWLESWVEGSICGSGLTQRSWRRLNWVNDRW